MNYQATKAAMLADAKLSSRGIRRRPRLSEYRITATISGRRYFALLDGRIVDAGGAEITAESHPVEWSVFQRGESAEVESLPRFGQPG